MQATNTAAARTTPANERRPFCERRIQAHRPAAGRNANRDVFVSAATPQSRPNASHDIPPSWSSMTSASQKIRVSKSAARLVSQTQRVHQYMTNGASAQSHALHTATLSRNDRLAIQKIGMQVSEEKMLLIASNTSAEPRL